MRALELGRTDLRWVGSNRMSAGSRGNARLPLGESARDGVACRSGLVTQDGVFVGVLKRSLDVGEGKADRAGYEGIIRLHSPRAQQAAEQFSTLSVSGRGEFEDVVESAEESRIEVMSGVRRGD